MEADEAEILTWCCSSMENACSGGWCCQSLGEWYFLAGASMNTCSWPFNSILLLLFLYFRYVFSILKDFVVLQQYEEYMLWHEARCHNSRRTISMPRGWSTTCKSQSFLRKRSPRCFVGFVWSCTIQPSLPLPLSVLTSISFDFCHFQTERSQKMVAGEKKG